MKKKILSLVLALLMAIPSAAFVAADDAAVTTETETTATEAAEPAPTAAVEDETAEDEESPYMYAVEFLAQYGIFKGYSADNPGIEDPIQRYQMALFVSRISTGWTDDEKWEDGSLNATPFYDVDVDPVNKYLGAISYANQKGIIEGVSAHHFEPQEGINYQDALTMLVRTLGWTGLKHPWGYIQKAVEIGLTEGIKDVAYTQELTRGEVAQLVYNALFIAGANGSKLALTNFGVEFGWETIIITASDRVKNDVSDKLATADGQTRDAYVAFRLFDETTGKATGDTYYALATALKLDATKNEDDAAVGHTYNVLFEKVSADATAKYGDSEIVNIVDVKSTYLTTVKNEGLTDDEGVARTTVNAIGAYLTDYTLVDKYTPAAYVGAVSDKISGTNTRALAKEIMIYNANGYSDVATGTDTRKIAINFQTQDILEQCTRTDHDHSSDEYHYTYKNSNNQNVTLYFNTAWYYNATLDRYYKYVYNPVTLADGTTTYEIAVDYMDDAKWESFYSKAVTTYTKVQALTTETNKGVFGAAYASLYLEDINYDGIADRGIYKTYHFGYFDANAKYNHNNHGEKPAYKLTTYNPLMNWDGTTSELGSSTFTVFSDPTNVCSDQDYTDAAWFADPTYVPKTGYAVYSYNTMTHEIEVVKELGTYAAPLGTDKDSYVARGVLQGYSVSKNTITIAGQKTLTADYSSLGNAPVCNMSARGDDTQKARNDAYAAGLYSMLEQYVEYVVVDGKIVHIQLAGKQAYSYLVVKEYVGMTNDGYIAVDAYDALSGELKTYAIASYNGWKQGDYYYFLTEDKVAEAFHVGSVYAVKSYDAENDVYYVEVAAEANTAGNIFIEDVAHLLTLSDMVHIVSTTDGYIEVYEAWDGSASVAHGPITKNVEASTTWQAVDQNKDGVIDSKDAIRTQRKANADKFIYVVTDQDGDPWHAPYYVKTGVLPNNWDFDNVSLVQLNDSNAHVFLIMNGRTTTAVHNLYKTVDNTRSNTGLFLYNGDKVNQATYDSITDEYYSTSLNAIVKDRYILGASRMIVDMINLYTGETVSLEDYNVDLVKNHVYVALEGRIVEAASKTVNDDETPVNVGSALYLVNWLNRYYPMAGGFTLADEYIYNSKAEPSVSTHTVGKAVNAAAETNYVYGTFFVESGDFGILTGTDNAAKKAYVDRILAHEYVEDATGRRVDIRDYAPYEINRNRVHKDRITIQTVDVLGTYVTLGSFADYVKAHPDVKMLRATYVYKQNGTDGEGSIMIYIDTTDLGNAWTSAIETKTGKIGPVVVEENVNGLQGVNIEATYEYTMNRENGEITKLVINNATFEITGARLNEYTHEELADKGVAFGHKAGYTGGLDGSHVYADTTADYAVFGAGGAVLNSASLDKVANKLTVATFADDKKGADWKEGCCDLVYKLTFTGIDIVLVDVPTQPTVPMSLRISANVSADPLAFKDVVTPLGEKETVHYGFDMTFEAIIWFQMDGGRLVVDEDGGRILVSDDTPYCELKAENTVFIYNQTTGFSDYQGDDVESYFALDFSKGVAIS